MVNRLILLVIIFTIILIGAYVISCPLKVKTVTVTGYVITKVWKKKSYSIHDEMSPRFQALLDNNDTVPCSSNSRVGDSVFYKYYTK